ncbi:Protein C37H5.5 [Aphelenchoides avenae]|nr:Protein C37H5.5 [Aphelenchus avenae]
MDKIEAPEGMDWLNDAVQSDKRPSHARDENDVTITESDYRMTSESVEEEPMEYDTVGWEEMKQLRPAENDEIPEGRNLKRSCLRKDEKFVEHRTYPRSWEHAGYEAALPREWDWRNVSGVNYCSPTRNQHIPVYCGSCWVFGSLGALNDRFNIARKNRWPMTMLSPQEIIDCNGKGSCQGGSVSDVYGHAKTHGLVEEGCNNYKAVNEKCTPYHRCGSCWPDNCFAIQNYTRYYVKDFGVVAGREKMMAEIHNRGPIACSIGATPKFDLNYTGGIYTEYSDIPSNHIVSVSGWGFDKETNVEYWIVRNSWGEAWGEKGWFRTVTSIYQNGRGDLYNLGIERECYFVDPDVSNLDYRYCHRLSVEMTAKAKGTVTTKQKRKTVRKLNKLKQKNKLKKHVRDELDELKNARFAPLRQRLNNIDEDYEHLRDYQDDEEDAELVGRSLHNEDDQGERAPPSKRRKKAVEDDENDDETEQVRRFRTNIAEDEAELLPIKLKGKLVRRVKKVDQHEDDEEDEDKPKEKRSKREPEEDLSGLTAAELLAKRNQLMQEAKLTISNAAYALTNDPQENILRLNELLKIASGEKAHSIIRESAQKLAVASLVEVFVDIIPGYHIRSLSEEEKHQSMKKETKKLFNYEQNLLRYYVKYLELLEKNALKLAKRDSNAIDESAFTHKMAMISARCFCRLITNVPHFNYATNIISCLVRLATSSYLPLVTEVCQALSTMFQEDIAYKISLRGVKTVAGLVTQKKCHVTPQLIATFLSLRIKEVEKDGAKEREKDKLMSKKYKLQKERKSKKRQEGNGDELLIYGKQLKKLESDLKEIEAAENVSTKLKYATETMKHVFATYFRVIRRMPNTALLEPVLEGLSKFAHLINVEFFDDLVSALEEIVDQKHLSTTDSLHCIRTVFVILSGEGQALNIDPIKFYKSLYSTVPNIPFQKDKNRQRKDVRLLVECLEIMLNKRRKLVPLVRVAAFAKRLLAVAFVLPDDLSTAILACLRTVFVAHPRLVCLVEDESDAVANGIFNADMNDPDCSNALSTSAVPELNKLRNRRNKVVAAFADNILHNIASTGAHRLNPQWSTIAPADFIENPLVAAAGGNDDQADAMDRIAKTAKCDGIQQPPEQLQLNHNIASPVRTNPDRESFASSRNATDVRIDDGWYTNSALKFTSTISNTGCQGTASANASRDDWDGKPMSSSPNGIWQALQPSEKCAQVDGSGRTEADTVSTSDEDWLTDAPEGSATTPQATPRPEVEAVSLTTMQNAGQNQQKSQRSNEAPPVNLQPKQSATNTASTTDAHGAAAASVQRIVMQNVRWRKPTTQAQQQTVQNAFAAAAAAQEDGGGGSHARRSSKSTGNAAAAQPPAVQILSAKNLRKLQHKMSAANRRADIRSVNEDDWGESTTEMAVAVKAIKESTSAASAPLDRKYYHIEPVEDVLEPPSAMCFQDDERLEVVVLDVRGPNELLVRRADQTENFRYMEQTMKQAWRSTFGPMGWCPIENRSYHPVVWWDMEQKRLLDLLSREPFVYCVEHRREAGHTRRVQVQSIWEDRDAVVWPPAKQRGPVWRARVYAIDYDEEYEVEATYLYWLDKRFYEQPACTFKVKVVDCDQSLPIMQKLATFRSQPTTKQEKERLICAFTEYSCSIVAPAEIQDENYEGFHCRFFAIPAAVKK